MMQTGVSQAGVSQTSPMRAQQIPYDPSMMQTGTSQIGVSQTVASQVGVSQAGVSQVGVSQTVASQVGVSQTVASQVGVSQTVQQPVQQEQKKSNKWILPVGIGACGVGVIAIIVAIVVAAGAGKGKDTQVANYETGGSGGSSYHESRDTEKSGSLILQPETETTEPETQVTEPVSSRSIVGNNPNNITQGAPMVQNNGYLYLRYPGVGLVRSDGDNSTVLDSSDTRCLSIVGDYLYYVDGDKRACYTKTDGSSSSAYVLALQSYEVVYLWVAEDGYFFLTGTLDNYTLNYVDSSGKNHETLTGFYNNNVAFMGDYIYYVSSNTGNGVQIYRVPASNLGAKAESVCTFSDMTEGVISDLVALDNRLYFCCSFTSSYDGELAAYDISTGDKYGYYLSDMFGDVYNCNLNVGDDGYVYFIAELEDSNLTVNICRVSQQEFCSGYIDVDILYTTATYHGVWSLNLITDDDYMTVGIFDSNFNEVLVGLNTDGSSSDPVVLGNN
jgi:hypothetical protein